VDARSKPILITPIRREEFLIAKALAAFVRSTDVRSAQQLSVLGTLPLLVILALISLNVIAVSAGLAERLAAVLLAIDLFAWPAVAATFDSERLIIGRHALRPSRPQVL
jgi:hypothetical protein